MERYTSCLASLSPCGKCDSKELGFFQLDLYTVWGSFIVNRSPYNTQKYFLPESCIHKSFLILSLLKLKSRWFCFLHGKRSEKEWRHTLVWGWCSPDRAWREQPWWATLKLRDFRAAWLLLREEEMNFKVSILKSILNLHFSKFV